MNRAVVDNLRTMSRHLGEIQDGVESCRSGLAFLGYAFKACCGMTLDERSAKGLGHILHILNVDLEATESEFEAVEQFLSDGQEEHVIDLDQMGGHGPAKDEEAHHG